VIKTAVDGKVLKFIKRSWKREKKTSGLLLDRRLPRKEPAPVIRTNSHQEQKPSLKRRRKN